MMLLSCGFSFFCCCLFSEKINENFSNYSAWHYRTVLLPRLYPAASVASDAALRARYEEVLDGEFHLVRQAFYTEPEDQSAWLYHRWLLGRVVAESSTAATTSGSTSSNANKLPVLGISLGTHLFDDIKDMDVDASSAAAATPTPAAAEAASASSAATAVSSSSSSSPSASALLSRQLSLFRRELHEVVELLGVEENCKWALLTAAILRAGVVACLLQQQEQAQGKDGEHADAGTTTKAEVEAEVAQLSAEMKATFERLIALDPFRRNYYLQVHQRFQQQ
jgi:hypothetical protein